MGYRMFLQLNLPTNTKISVPLWDFCISTTIKMDSKKMIIVLGAGESGIGSAILAQKKGFDVLVSDFGSIKDQYRNVLIDKGIGFEEKAHDKVYDIIDRTVDAEHSIEVVKSPGIPEKSPIIKAIRAKNIKVISEIEFASRYTNAKTICITGSNGKTTTTTLIYHILKSAGLNVGLAGNIGKSFALQVAESNFDYYVLEISSFQLDDMYDFRADIAIITNITPDHLDRYEYRFQNYIDAKFRILQNQTESDYFIFWASDPIVAAEISKRNIVSIMLPFDLNRTTTSGVENFAFVDDKDNIVIQTPSHSHFVDIPVESLAIKGTHNIYNSMAAAIAAQLVGVEGAKLCKALATFEGVKHRMEYVATIDGVCYINDSKATNVNSCWYALQSMKTPTVLILGGTDKGNDYTEIDELVRQKVRSLVFLGVDNSKLIKFFEHYRTVGGEKIPYSEARSMKEAICLASNAAQAGDTVLLSPCCASFDLFNNYEDRGDQFKQAVLEMKKS